MKVTEITVHAGRTISHPLESYANLRPAISLKAVLDDGDDAATCIRKLQAQAEGLVEDHKNLLLRQIVDNDQLKRQAQELVRLERQISEGQERLQSLRELQAKGLPMPEEQRSVVEAEIVDDPPGRRY